MSIKEMLQRVIASAMSFLTFGEKHLPEAPITRVSVLASGKVLVDGKETNLSELRNVLARAKFKKQTLWYYRERAKGGPPAQAVEAFKLIVESKLAISVSTKADFSDYVDENGESRARG